MIPEIEHIVIRKPQFVAGSKDKPEVGVFVQTHKSKLPLNANKLKSGQIVWMKWSGGPIIARSKILSLHDGFFTNANIKEIRDLTKGTELFGLDKYWESVSDKKNGYFTVVRLRDEEWLDILLYPKPRSYGSSWVYLETIEDKELWLGNTVPPSIIDNNKGRNIPVSLRFEVLRRDNFTCRYCGRKAPQVELHIDHVIPWKDVKKHDINNLVTSCKDCNLGKGANHIGISIKN